MARIKDLTGQRFGRLVVTRDTLRRNKSGNVVWECKCDCGKITIVSSDHLKSGSVRSCGCLHIGINLNDLTGERFGRLIAIKCTSIRKNGNVLWDCKCDCGASTLVKSSYLKNGRTKSCGCLAKEEAKNVLDKLYKINSNLRFEGTMITQLTAKTSINNTSGNKGVSWNKKSKKYEAYIMLKGKRINLGYYNNI